MHLSTKYAKRDPILYNFLNYHLISFTHSNLSRKNAKLKFLLCINFLLFFCKVLTKKYQEIFHVATSLSKYMEVAKQSSISIVHVFSQVSAGFSFSLEIFHVSSKLSVHTLHRIFNEYSNEYTLPYKFFFKMCRVFLLLERFFFSIWNSLRKLAMTVFALRYYWPPASEQRIIYLISGFMGYCQLMRRKCVIVLLNKIN